MKAFTVYGERVKACNKNCADCYRQDIRMSIYYGPVQLANGQRVCWAEGSRKAGYCVYCGSVEQRPAATLYPPSSPRQQDLEDTLNAGYPEHSLIALPGGEYGLNVQLAAVCFSQGWDIDTLLTYHPGAAIIVL